MCSSNERGDVSVMMVVVEAVCVGIPPTGRVAHSAVIRAGSSWGCTFDAMTNGKLCERRCGVARDSVPGNW